jgi:hypothetical protein
MRKMTLEQHDRKESCTEFLLPLLYWAFMIFTEKPLLIYALPFKKREKSVVRNAKGNVIAKDKKEAEKLIQGGQWNDIDIDVEDVITVEHLKESLNDKQC